jgi:chromodomain-helicase-DNA-binding protein 1
LLCQCRHNSRRANAVSYKEDSDEKTDSDDVLEVDNNETQDGVVEPETPTKTIEKVIAQRRGKIGGKLRN